MMETRDEKGPGEDRVQDTGGHATPSQTPRELYDQRFEDIARVMDWIGLELDKHKISAQADPGNFGSAGDLGHVREKLIETLAFLSDSETEEIENLLDECRGF